MKPVITMAALAAALTLSGCISGPIHAARDDEYCKGLGAKPGTELYIQCRLQADNNRSARMSAHAQRQMSNQYFMNSMRPNQF